MKEAFKVLWFDDNREYLDSLDFGPLESAIRSWGFVPEIHKESEAAQFMSHSPFADIELIVVDYDLGEQVPHGEAFIKKIRENSVLTEVVFYTAHEAKDLWTAICANELEGVFVANRREVISKVIKVSRQTIETILDLNNIRGIVMAQVGDLDLLIESAVVMAWDSLSKQEQQDITTRFREKSLKDIDSTRQRIDEFSDKTTIAEILEACDSQKRWENFIRVRKIVQELKSQAFGDYPTEVLFKRNCLAHGQATEDQGVQIFTFRGKQYRFDEEEGVKLRQTILQYKGQFQTANDALKKVREAT